MTYNHRDDDLFINESTYTPLSIQHTNNIQKNPVSHTHKTQSHKSNNRIINILSSNKNNNKLEFNEEFQEYLAMD